MTDTAVFRRLDLFAGLDETALRSAVRELDAVVVPAGDEFDIAASGAVCGIVGAAGSPSRSSPRRTASAPSGCWRRAT